MFLETSVALAALSTCHFGLDLQVLNNATMQPLPFGVIHEEEASLSLDQINNNNNNNNNNSLYSAGSLGTVCRPILHEAPGEA